MIDSRTVFTRRVWLFRLLAVLVFCLLWARVIDLQWFQHEDLSLRAEQNRIDILPVLPTRGELLDRYGQGIAINQVRYRVELIPDRVQDMDATITSLRAILHWSPFKHPRILRRLQYARPDRPVLIIDQLSWQQAAPLMVQLYHLPGVVLRAEASRFYPNKGLTANLTGYLSIARPADVQKGFLAHERIGRTGLEARLEARLHGAYGSKREEVDATGHLVRVLHRTAPKTGETIRLSIDLNMQKEAARIMGKRTGAVVALDVHTGEVLVLLSTPSYDPNRFVYGLSQRQWNAWRDDPRHPMLDRSIQSSYPPASTFKLLVALSALKHHIPLATEQTRCKGFIEVGSRRLRCWKRRGHQKLGMHTAIMRSCDVYFYELGAQLGIQALHDDAHLWGFGERTGIALSRETRGLAPGERRDGSMVQRWFTGQTMIASIGQGSVNVTPLQMARFIAALANGGDLLQPHVLADEPVHVLRHLDVADEHLQTLRAAMRDVVKKPHGTAYRAFLHAPLAVAGKTGTAQVISMSQDEHASRIPEYDLHKDHAWFVGFAPYKDPQIAIAVFVEHGGHGGSAAGPIAAAVLKAWAERHHE